MHYYGKDVYKRQATVNAGIKEADVFLDSNWTYAGESTPFADGGWLQAICDTENYIIGVENASNTNSDPDTLVAFYKNDYDENGNPVQQFSYAKHVDVYKSQGLSIYCVDCVQEICGIFSGVCVYRFNLLEFLQQMRSCLLYTSFQSERDWKGRVGCYAPWKILSLIHIFGRESLPGRVSEKYSSGVRNFHFRGNGTSFFL